MTLMKPEIRAVLFDKDGTLIDYERSWGATNRRAAALAALGDDALERRFLELGGVDPQSGRTRADSLFAAGNTREIATCFVDAGSPVAVDGLVAALDRIFVAAVDDAVPVADLGEIFGTLRRAGMVIGIASSDSEGAIRAMVERFGVGEHVAFIAGYDSGHGTKPGPGMVIAFAEAVGLSPREIAVVGDNLHDMRMASAGGAGLRVAVLTGTGDHDTLGAESDVCLPSIRSLLIALPDTSCAAGDPQDQAHCDERLRSTLTKVAEIETLASRRSSVVPVLTSHIGGAYLPLGSGAETFATIDPATGEVLADIAIAGEAEVNRAVELAREAQRGWGAMTGAERGRILQRVAARLRERNAELALLETRDTGKPIQETEAVDVLSGADCIEYFAGLAASLAGEHVDLGPQAFGYTRREPLGVVAGIGAWNYPIQIACWKAAPALAAGNAVIFKPAELTPLTALKLAEVMTECGVPPGVFNVVQGDGRTGRLLSRHPGIAKISLTGEVGTGKKVMADASSTLKQVTLELGGKSPLIVFPDADLDDAVGGALLANFYSAGEVCSNGTRVFVHAEVREAFLEKLAARTRAMRVGDPKDPATQVGALISEAHMRKVLSYIEEGRNEGAKVLVGGSRVTAGALGDGFFVEPTVFDACTDDMRIVREEIFGPVMTVLSFTDEDEVVRRANDTPFGLAAGVFTRDLARAHRVVARLEAGTTWINTYNITPIELPFGGAKQSGLGRENGRAALFAHTEVKSVYVNLGRVEAPY